MEIVIALIVIAAIMLILGVSLTSIAAGIMLLLIAVLLFMLIFFLVCGFMLLRSKRADAEFDGFENNGRFDCAVYLCGDERERLINIFPAESILREQIYKSGECRVNVFRTRKKAFAIDRHSMVIIIAGLVLTIPGIVSALYEMTAYFN